MMTILLKYIILLLVGISHFETVFLEFFYFFIYIYVGIGYFSSLCWCLFSASEKIGVLLEKPVCGIL